MTTIPDAAIEAIVRDCSVEHDHPEYGQGLFTTDLELIVERVKQAAAEHLMPAPPAEGDVRERGTKGEREHLIDEIGRVMLAEWERVEGAPLNVSYVATLADGIRAVLGSGFVVPVGEVEQLRVALAQARGLWERTRRQRYRYEQAVDQVRALMAECDLVASNPGGGYVPTDGLRRALSFLGVDDDPIALPARNLSDEHVGAVVRYRGVQGVLVDFARTASIDLDFGWRVTTYVLAPDDVVEFVDGSDS